jgi:hypothetical protein
MTTTAYQKKEYEVYAENEAGTIQAEMLKNEGGKLSFRITLVTMTRVAGKTESKSFGVSVPGYLGPYKSPWKTFATEEIRDLAFDGLYNSQGNNGRTDCLVFNDLTFQQVVYRKPDSTLAMRRSHVHTKMTFNTASGKGGKSFPTTIALRPVSNGSYNITIANAHDSVRCADGVYRKPFISPSGLRGFAQLFSLCLTNEKLKSEYASFPIPLARDKVALAGFTHWLVWFRTADVQAEAIRLCHHRTEISRLKFEADEISRLYAENNYDKNAPEYKNAWDTFNAVRDRKEEFAFSPIIVPAIFNNGVYEDVDASLRSGTAEATALLEVCCPNGKAPSTLFSRAAADASRASGQAPQTMADVG